MVFEFKCRGGWTTGRLPKQLPGPGFQDLGSYAYPSFFFQKFQTHAKMRFLALVKHNLHYQPRVLELPILFPQGPEQIVTFVYVSAILNCVYTIRSGTDQLSIFIDKFCVQRSKRRVSQLLERGLQLFGTQGKQNTAAQQQGKLNMQVSSLACERHSIFVLDFNLSRGL